MRFFTRRLGASCILAGILLAGGLAAPAGAVTYDLTVAQSAPSPLRAGSPQVVTATVTADGAPAPDGTLVHFSVDRNPGEFTIEDHEILTSAGIGNGAMHGTDGYWLVDALGNVFAYGNAPVLGGLPSKYGLLDWVVGIAPTATGNGYWVATLDGKVYPFGDAGEGVIDHGPFEDDWAIGIVPASGAGAGTYRLVTATGRTLPSSANLNPGTAALFGDAPAMGAVATPSGNGYWVFSGKGQIAGFGDAGFFGDLRANTLSHTIISMAPAPFGTGYWLLADDGFVYAYGSAKFLGTPQAGDPNAYFTVILPSISASGYRVATYQGRIHGFGDAVNYGSLWDVPTRSGKAVFGYTSVTPGSTTVTVLGPPSMADTAMATVTTEWTPADGYWMLSADGAVYPFGGAVHLGDAKPHLGGRQAVDLEPTADYGGYWIVDDIGRVFGFGNAKGNLGNVDAGALRPGEKVTSLSSTPTGGGYWIFTSQGRVFAKGDATHFGDMAGTALNGPVLDSIPTPTGHGYYMVGSDGGIFAFGDATFNGSMGGRKLNAPVQSLVPDPDGAGYWLVASDGGIFAFDADFHGSMGATRLNKPVTGMVAFGNAYLMVGEDGGIFNFSDRPFYGSLGGNPPPSPIVSVAILDPFGT